ncbi:MAG TPA: sugar transferase [Chthoniobacteraceae bacterium]|jgi:exopolysaccharide biosynthesis polyprenyl glycosylphosphotransferase|nr:sugar transferase [Chthoniobacteraceae bacterium]
MLGRRQELNLQFLQILDGLLMALAFYLAHRFRFIGASWFVFDRPIGAFSEFSWLLYIVVPFVPISLELQGFYLHGMHKKMSRSLEQIARSAFWVGLVIAGCAYFLKLSVPSRAVMPLFALFAGVTLLARERLTVARLHARARREDLREPVLLAGTRADMHQFRHTFTAEQLMQIHVVAEIDLVEQTVPELIELLHKHSVSRVIFAGGHSMLGTLQEAIRACEIEGVEAWLVADFIQLSIARPTFDVFGNRPMLVFRTTPEISWALLLKTVLDRAGAVVGLLLFTLPMCLIALAIRFTSPGPAIFRQERGGKNGKPFTMFKFRTMYLDAPDRHAELAGHNEMSGPVFKIDKDPRITPLGRFLRRTSLDEFPQFLNVLKGEMSLVGPRPLPVYEVEKFENTAQRRRLSMKPGLTCLWQISGRNKISSFEEWVRLDLEYIDNWSLLLDFKIILLTIPVLLLGRGAK